MNKPADSSSDDELKTSMTMVRDAQSFDDDAWERLVETYTPLIRYWIVSKGIQREDASDCCQEVFLKASRRLPHFVKNTPQDTFRGWLRSITNRTIADFYKRREKERGVFSFRSFHGFKNAPIDDVVGSEMTSQVLGNERHLLAMHVLNLIRRDFSDKQTTAFLEVVMNQKSPSDVAAKLNTSVNNVYKAKCRILAKIRQHFPDSTT